MLNGFEVWDDLVQQPDSRCHLRCIHDGRIRKGVIRQSVNELTGLDFFLNVVWVPELLTRSHA